MKLGVDLRINGGQKPKGFVRDEDKDNPVSPVKMTTAGPQPWHADVIYLREEEGLSIRECARLCGVTFSRVQKFLNPVSKAKAKARHNEWDRKRRATDPEYAQESRDYRRRYAHARKGLTTNLT